VEDQGVPLDRGRGGVCMNINRRELAFAGHPSFCWCCCGEASWRMDVEGGRGREGWM